MDKKKHSLNNRENELTQDQDNLIKIIDLEENHLKTLEKALELVSQLTDTEQLVTLEKGAEVSLLLLVVNVVYTAFILIDFH